MKEPIVSFKDFTFRYRAQKQPTIKNINLDIYPGEKVLIIGPSGSGKSTIASCINGLIPFSYPGEFSGSLTVNGIDAPNSSIFTLSTVVGTVLQDPDGQFIGLTVAEDIAFALENQCVEQTSMKETVKKVSSLVNIDSHLDHAPHELSGGQKQRVGLAGVMVDDVKILLFDEPLANLDPASGKQTIELIEEIQKKTDTTVIIIEHRLEDVLWSHVDRIILINDGTIVSDTTPNKLLSSPLLKEHGIREPLYITALKYANVSVTEEKDPQHINSVILNNEDKAKVKSWFMENRKEPKENNNEPILEIKDLSFGYFEEDKTLQNINFSIKKGEMASIIGRNGAGKSTLCKLICGFEKPNTGAIFLNGKNLEKDTIRERASKIGYVMQNPNQMISKTLIFDEVALGLNKTGLSPEEIT
ncbi:MAG: ABC transporter ATP-binding protein, partial [Sphaerochaetaceae bacterium]|nr:ABC transporter ATP-binding protein [Sphaerochaetaceae bacterium]